MGNASINRHEWLKAVNMDGKLSHRAVRVAVALWRCANETDAHVYPGMTYIMENSALSLDTAKRAIADLVQGGWIHKTEGRGAGNRVVYTFCSPGKVIPISSAKKGANTLHKKGCRTALSGQKKGAELREKGCRTALSYNKDKQSLEQKARATPDRPAPAAQYCVSRGSPAEADWNRWLDAHGFPSLIELNQRLGDGWNLPATLPPTDPTSTEWRIAEKWAVWATWRKEDRRCA